MLNWFYTLIYGEIKSLENILKPVNKLWVALDHFAQRSEELVGMKKQQVSDLNSQIDDHVSQKDKALKVQQFLDQLVK